jgi:hypothetical protein
MKELGPIYSPGRAYRARAEARQREYRASVLMAGHGDWGHVLSPEAAAAGHNFLLPEAHEAARARERAGKGVTQRTFENMLSSQAMCFNILAPLAARLELATEVLAPFIPGLRAVTAIHLEHTPAADIFRDQSGLGGVDCDVLIEADTSGGVLIQVVETKFVEPEFSTCGFRKAGRAKKGQDVCPDEVPVRDDRNACLYTSKKGYEYWRRTDEFDLLADGALPATGCPFAGDHWQLWVNLALAHAEGARRGADHVRFAVCSSAQNSALLGDGGGLDAFRGLLREPEAVSLIDLEILVSHVREVAPPQLAGWAAGLGARYAGI